MVSCWYEGGVCGGVSFILYAVAVRKAWPHCQLCSFNKGGVASLSVLSKLLVLVHITSCDLDFYSPVSVDLVGWVLFAHSDWLADNLNNQ